MLIPFGVFSAAGAGVSNSYELISTAFGTGASSTITFSSLPAGYKHYQIRSIAKPDVAGDGNTYLRFNADTGSNYAWHYLLGNGTAVSSGAGSTQNLIYVNSIYGTKGANSYTATIIDFLDVTGTKNKTIRSFFGGPGGDSLAIFSGLWQNTGAITSISLTTTVGNFTTGSRFSLYGIKG